MKQGTRVWWKSSPQSPWKITLYFEMHSQRGTDLHSLAEFTDTCFFVGWLLFPWWLYWQGWMLCRALLVFSVCGQEIQGGKPWWFLSFLTSGILQRSGPLQGKIKSHSYDYSSVKLCDNRAAGTRPLCQVSAHKQSHWSLSGTLYMFDVKSVHKSLEDQGLDCTLCASQYTSRKSQSQHL